jgi:hypothetical protein
MNSFIKPNADRMINLTSKHPSTRPASQNTRFNATNKLSRPEKIIPLFAAKEQLAEISPLEREYSEEGEATLCYLRRSFEWGYVY